MNTGIPKSLVKILAGMMETDKSPIVRAMTIRFLYHQSSECWPYDQDDRETVFRAITRYCPEPPFDPVAFLGMGGLDGHVAREALLIEQKLRWLDSKAGAFLYGDRERPKGS